jgi:hypothetical protein
MEKFIILREIKIGGVIKPFYHESVRPSENQSAMNVYVENVETDKKKAKVFYDKKEVDAMAVFLESSMVGGGKSTVISIK